MMPNPTPLQANGASNTVMPTNMVGPGAIPAGSLNLEQKRQEKKVAQEKKRKQRLTYIYLSLSIVGLIVYSILFFYPNLVAYIQAPRDLQNLESEIEKKNRVVIALQEEKGLHQAAYDEGLNQKVARVDAYYPRYNKLSLIKDIEEARNTLSAFRTFDMNAITVEPPIPGKFGLETLVAGTFRADKDAFEAFMGEYVGGSGNLENPNSTPIKSFRQINVKPVEIKSTRSSNGQTVTEPGYNVSFQLAFYTRPEETN